MMVQNPGFVAVERMKKLEKEGLGGDIYHIVVWGMPGFTEIVS
jgi:hypothetical protein